MKILAINTALPQTEVVLFNGDQVLLNKSWPSNYDEAEKLLPVIKGTFKNLEGLDKILVIAGPGAFTGLRVGITIANTLAFTQKVPIISISTFEYLQHKIPEKQAATTAIMMRAGSGVAIWLPQDKKIHKVKKDEIESFLARHTKIEQVVSDVRDDSRENYTLSKGVKWKDISSLNDFSEIIKHVLAEKHPEHKQIKPQYLAPPHITKSKKQIFA